VAVAAGTVGLRSRAAKGGPSPVARRGGPQRDHFTEKASSVLVSVPVLSVKTKVEPDASGLDPRFKLLRKHAAGQGGILGPPDYPAAGPG